jgi:signal transduction histidine kinase
MTPGVIWNGAQHDGAQQRLISMGLRLRSAEASLPPELQDHKRQLSDNGSGLTGVSEDLREISRGIHPGILSKGGLRPALKTLARRSPVPVNLDLAIDRRLADSVEVATHYVVAEALTNTAKHAQASEVTVSAPSRRSQPLSLLSLDSRQRRRRSRLPQRVRTYRAERPRRGACRTHRGCESPGPERHCARPSHRPP